MIGDINNQVSTAQAVTVSAVSTSSIDLLARQDIGAGATKLRLHVAPTTTVLPVHGANVAVTFTDAGDLVGLTAHGLPVGTPVVFNSITSTTGITAGTIYYVTNGASNPAADTFMLASTRALAMQGVTTVALTTDGTGTMTVLADVDFQIITADDADLTLGITVIGSSGPIQYPAARTCTFNATTNVCTLATHSWPNGTPVRFSGAGTQPAEITAGVTYFVTNAAAGTFQIATTLDNARNGVALDLTTAGSGVLAVTPVTGHLVAAGAAGTASPPVGIVTVEINPQYGSIGQRYLGCRYWLANGAFSAGAFTAKFALDPGDTPKVYPTGTRYLL